MTEPEKSSGIELGDPKQPELEEVEGETEGTPVQKNTDKKVKKIKKIKKKRPARAQVDPATFKTEPPPQTGTVFNIWYNKWSGGDRDQNTQHAAPNRCNIARDSGYTRADSTPGSYFCLFFARGICPKGRDCQYLHRLPGLHDIFSPQVDCFGREKFADYRDDMGGVGSFMRMNRTLYIGRIHVTDDIEEIVSRHFQEWGQIDRIRVLTNRGVAFVTYSNMANSEFAKEAMAHQALDHEEVLNVRWATVDPNPAAQKREARAIEDQAAAAIRAALPPEYVAQLEGRDPDAKKRRKLEGSFGLDGYEAPDDVWQAREQANRALQWRTQSGEHVEAEAEMVTADGQKLVEGSQNTTMSTSNTSIFSNATLAALNGRAYVGSNRAPAPVGSLVGYGSGDDSD